MAPRDFGSVFEHVNHSHPEIINHQDHGVGTARINIYHTAGYSWATSGDVVSEASLSWGRS